MLEYIINKIFELNKNNLNNVPKKISKHSLIYYDFMHYLMGLIVILYVQWTFARYCYLIELLIVSVLFTWMILLLLRLCFIES